MNLQFTVKKNRRDLPQNS